MAEFPRNSGGSLIYRRLWLGSSYGHNVLICLLFCALIVMGKHKVHAYLRITQSTFFYCSLIGLDKKGFLQPGNMCQENQQSLRSKLVLLERIRRVHDLHLFFQEILNYRPSESLLLHFSGSVWADTILELLLC